MSALEWLYAENSLIYHNQQVNITAGDVTSETNKPKYFYLNFAFLSSYLPLYRRNIHVTNFI